MDSRVASFKQGGGFLSPIVGRLQSMLSDAQVNGQRMALLLVHSAAIARVDLQQGFSAGDRLSKLVSSALRSRVLRESDVLEVLSREEFCCILRPVSSDGIAMLAAHRVMDMLGSIPFDIGGKSELADLTVGIAMFPGRGFDAETLLQQAKYALRTAQGHGSRISVAEADAAVPAVGPSQYAERMRRALERNTLSLHYMPTASLRSGRLVGAEALLRWTDDVLGEVSPQVAVQCAEAAGLMDQFTQWVITSAVQQCMAFQAIDPQFTVSVNISPSNLNELDLPLFIDRALRTWDVNSGGLILEITESAMMKNPNDAIKALCELKSKGVRLSIDDFGTGYSSMYYLAQLPLDELKIDMSFVRTMLETPINAKIVLAMVDLAHNLNLTVVAEGVENDAIKHALQHLNCDHMQGYHVGRAVPGAELVVRLLEQARLSGV